MKSGLRLALLLLLAALPCADGATTVGVVISSVPYTISKPGAYRLGKDLVLNKSAGAAITITATNAVLDLNGFTLTAGTAVNTSTTSGISIQAPGVTVQDGRIIGFGDGVSSLQGTESTVIQDLACQVQTGLAAISLGGVNATVTRVRITNPTQGVSASVGILASYSAVISNCSISDLRAPSGTYVVAFYIGASGASGGTDLVTDSVASNLSAVSGSANTFTVFGGGSDTIIDRCYFYNMPGGVEVAGGGHITFKNCDFRSCGSSPLDGASDAGGNSNEP